VILYLLNKNEHPIKVIPLFLRNPIYREITGFSINFNVISIFVNIQSTELTIGIIGLWEKRLPAEY
jgi:hypothetical protein